MKTLVILVLLGGVIGWGGAFFGAWTIPGLEGLPTAESVGKSRAESVRGEAVRRYDGEVERPKSIRWGARPDGALGTRAEQLKSSETNMAK